MSLPCSGGHLPGPAEQSTSRFSEMRHEISADLALRCDMFLEVARRGRRVAFGAIQIIVIVLGSSVRVRCNFD